ncbi:uncharacterized protein EI90DRAFT_3055820 [Cantharellus anzutake]|uniref:uncharacterized protein n=1 Tax=Cantharellus anzutake TaxID=1750568 RepID=UPI00190307A5|nr:uncharacterized protein EI90DRAFT_3055820 [Cantharellus anzutake]KAF8331900.1 hypothetical protein EI90DRAFT_3055820 [Cantharellus anzutake]
MIFPANLISCGLLVLSCFQLAAIAGPINHFERSIINSAGTPRAINYAKQNALQAQMLNGAFQTIDSQTACNRPSTVCVNNNIALCSSRDLFDTIVPCTQGTKCFALPLKDPSILGTEILCVTPDEAAQRFQDALAGQ